MGVTPKHTGHGRLDVYEIGVELLRSLKSVVRVVGRRDVDLARQGRRAASSFLLNLAEAMGREGGDRKYRLRMARGSALEVSAFLDVAETWDYVAADSLEEPRAILDRVRAMLYRLTR